MRGVEFRIFPDPFQRDLSTWNGVDAVRSIDFLPDTSDAALKDVALWLGYDAILEYVRDLDLLGPSIFKRATY